MSVLVACSECQSALRVKGELSGQRVRCPKCGTAVRVPGDKTESTASDSKAPSHSAVSSSDEGTGRVVSATEDTVATASDKPVTKKQRSKLPRDPAVRYRQLETDVIRAVDGSIQPVRVPVTYRIGILLVLIVMVLLPLIYLGLIGAAGYAVYWHAVSHTGLLTAELGVTSGRNAARARAFAALLYVAPMVVGGILVLFMLKPLLSRPSQQRKPRTLSRGKEPLLFAFVDRLCDAVHAPRPKRINVDLQVNASASFRSGLLSMLGSDLVLTIGLPLVAGLNMRQFAGVLAHEFGHFSQGAGMRVTYVIRSISHWFERVVYERDAWDERLTQWSQEWDLRVGWILWIARGFVWLTRRVLWCLMMVGHIVAGFMLRQMEFDADRHEARFSGSDAFDETMRALPLLSLADQQSWNQLGSYYQEGRLVDDLPKLTVMNSKQLPLEARDYVNQMTTEAATGLFDTHPSGKDRIASAQRENAAGIFRLKHPAGYLFHSFPAICRATTVDLYRTLFEREFDPNTLASVDELFAHQQAEENDHNALKRFFQRRFTFYRPLAVSADRVIPPTEVSEAVDLLRKARRRMETGFKKVALPLKAYQDAENQLADARRARPILAAGIGVSATTFDVDLSSFEKADRVEADAHARQEATQDALATFDRIASKRLTTSLSLLSVPDVASQIEDATGLQQRCRKLLDVQDTLASQLPSAIDLLDQHAVMQMCLMLLNSNSDDEKAGTLLRKTAREVVQTVRGMHATLDHQAYPFDHARGDISIAKYILAELPHSDDLGGYYEAAESMSSTLLRLYSRTLGGLCLIAEQVEMAIGLEPLPEAEVEEA